MEKLRQDNFFEKFMVFVAVTAVFVFLVTLGTVNSVQATGEAPQFNKEGQLIRPEGYRSWMFVGSIVTPNDMNEGKAAFPGFHVVYINPESYKEFERTGTFPDGTILAKDLIGVGAKHAASGNGYFMNGYTGLGVAVKDSARFPDEPGNWAYFDFSQPNSSELAKTADAKPASECNACHQANAATDWVFTQYYPVLQAPKAK
jgi:hypothetical protein